MKSIQTINFVESDWIVEDIGQDKIKIYYHIFKGNDPKPFILKKKISINENLAEIVGLYLGDGKLTPKDMAHTEFTNKDMDLIKKMFEFFKFFGINSSEILCTIDYTKGNVSEIKNKVSNYLGKRRFRMVKTDRNRYPSIHLQIGGKIFRKIFEKILLTSLAEIIKKSKLRRAFLKGYFSAEGWIGYSRKENYITCIGFAYNPKKEVWLRDYCMRCLKMEGITSHIVIKHEEHNGQIIITNWVNYYKAWKLGIFDGCQRKKIKFIKIFQRIKICCEIKKNMRQKLFSRNQYKLAKELATSQGTISNMKTANKRNFWPTIHQIEKLSEINKISINDIKKNIKRVRFGNMTSIDANQELIDDVFNRESLCSSACQEDIPQT